MRFVLVNGRTPRSQSFCAVCCEPISESYLREIATRLSYCDRKCYLSRSMRIVPPLQYHSSALGVAPPPGQQAGPNLTVDGMR
jgi:hypothetical protein